MRRGLQFWSAEADTMVRNKSAPDGWSRIRGRFARWLTAISTLLCISGSGISTVQGQTLPEQMTGIWVEGDCAVAQRVRLLNSFGVIDFVPIRGVTYVQILVFQQIIPKDRGRNVESKLLSPNTGEVLDYGFQLQDAKLDGTFVRCLKAPPWLVGRFGEAIAALTALGTIQAVCGQGDSRRCLQAAFEYADVTRDGRLTVAEVSRVLRAVGFLLGYISQPQGLVAVDTLTGVVALAGLAGPFLVRTLVDGMDYNGDGAISLDELLQDRGDAAGVLAAASALEPAAAQTALRAVAAALPGIVEFVKMLR